MDNVNLSQDQFFHGTTATIKDGVVKPAWALDRDVSEHSMGDPGDMSEGDHAFVIRNDERYAWHAAQTFHPSAKRRAKVYEVEPAADMKPGPWNKDHPDFLHHVEYGDPEEYPPHENKEAHDEALAQHQDEWGSKTGFKIKQRHDIMPGRQGTFPTVNWNRYKDWQRAPQYRDANHPSDHDIHAGLGAEIESRNADTLSQIMQRKVDHAERKGRVLPIVPGKRPATLFD